MDDKRNVLVTGATSGIGLATAIHLAQGGFTVFASGRSDEKLARLVAAAAEAGVAVHPVLLDVTSESSIQAARMQIIDETNGHGLDALVNNAGYGEAGAIEEIPIARLRAQLETNVIGLVAVTQAFLPEMRARQHGRIVNISSVVGKLSLPLMAAYAASKHAVEALSDGMRIELAPAGIDVVIVAPGRIESQFGSTLTATMADWISPESPYRSHYQRWSRMRSFGAPATSANRRPPDWVARAVRTALETAQPKARYAVTVESKVMPWVVSLTPKRVLDSLLRRFMM